MRESPLSHHMFQSVYTPANINIVSQNDVDTEIQKRHSFKTKNPRRQKCIPRMDGANGWKENDVESRKFDDKVHTNRKVFQEHVKRLTTWSSGKKSHDSCPGTTKAVRGTHASSKLSYIDLLPSCFSVLIVHRSPSKHGERPLFVYKPLREIK